MASTGRPVFDLFFVAFQWSKYALRKARFSAWSCHSYRKRENDDVLKQQRVIGSVPPRQSCSSEVQPEFSPEKLPNRRGVDPSQGSSRLRVVHQMLRNFCDSPRRRLQLGSIAMFQKSDDGCMEVVH
jgi:hypothetical protein